VIDHTLDPASVPPLAIFWSTRYGRLKAALEELGYEVVDRAHELKWWRARQFVLARLSKATTWR
jgi:hypothetical protein